MLSYTLCVFCRRLHLLGCFRRRLLGFCVSGGGSVPRAESSTRQVWLGLPSDFRNVNQRRLEQKKKKG